MATIRLVNELNYPAELPSTFVKHSAVVQMSGHLSRNQRLTYNLMLAVAQKEFGSRTEHSINLSTIRKYVSSKSKNTDYYKQLLVGLMNVPVKFNLFQRDKENKKIWEVHTHLFTEIMFSDTSDEIRYSFSPQFRKLLADPSFYVKVDLPTERKFCKPYTLPIYEYSMDMLGGRRNYCTFVLAVDDLKSICGIDGFATYNSFKNLNAKVLKTALAEIEQHSGVSVSVDQITRGRKVVQLNFSVKRKSTSDEGTRTSKLQVSEKQLADWNQVYGEAEVGKAIQYVDGQLSKKDIDRRRQVNVVGYITKCLAEGFHRSSCSNHSIQHDVAVKNTDDSYEARFAERREGGKSIFGALSEGEKQETLESYVETLGGREQRDWEIDPNLETNHHIRNLFYVYLVNSHSKISN